MAFPIPRGRRIATCGESRNISAAGRTFGRPAVDRRFGSWHQRGMRRRRANSAGATDRPSPPPGPKRVIGLLLDCGLQATAEVDLGCRRGVQVHRQFRAVRGSRPWSGAPTRRGGSYWATIAVRGKYWRGHSKGRNSGCGARREIGRRTRVQHRPFHQVAPAAVPSRQRGRPRRESGRRGAGLAEVVAPLWVSCQHSWSPQVPLITSPLRG